VRRAHGEMTFHFSQLIMRQVKHGCLGRRVFSLRTARLLQRVRRQRLSHARSLRGVWVDKRRLSYTHYRSFLSTQSNRPHAGVPGQLGSGSPNCIDSDGCKEGSWAREAVAVGYSSIASLEEREPARKYN